MAAPAQAARGELPGPLGRRQDGGGLRTAAIIITIVLHAGVFAGLWIARAAGAHPSGPAPGHFVDAQLVRFGRPRDLSFLPHKQGVIKTHETPQIKVARDLNALPRLDKPKPPPDDTDPLKKTHADEFKHLADEPEGFQNPNVGSLSGSRAGTASEASGDPYIASLMDAIGSAWTVPTTIREASKLSADACLTISDGGRLTHFEITRPSGNSQFDSSFQAALGTIKQLQPPPDRFKRAAARGGLCATFFPPQ